MACILGEYSICESQDIASFHSTAEYIVILLNMIPLKKAATIRKMPFFHLGFVQCNQIYSISQNTPQLAEVPKLGDSPERIFKQNPHPKGQNSAMGAVAKGHP
jgi:hypothetical protein